MMDDQLDHITEAFGPGRWPGTVATPPPGVYRHIPAEAYHKWDAMSNSRLKVLAQQSPKHFKWEMEHPRPQTKAMRQGTILHKLCLERFAFAKDFAIAPDGLNRTARKGWAAFEEANAPKECLTLAEFNKAVATADALMVHTRARTLLTDGEPEVSVVWQDDETGVVCKARLDYLLPPAVGDVKTTADGDEWAFAKATASYGYYRQAAFYLDGATACGLPVHMFALAVVESEPPHDVYVCTLGARTLLAGRHGYRKALHEYKACLETNDWPGRHESDVFELDIPKYALEDEGILIGAEI